MAKYFTQYIIPILFVFFIGCKKKENVYTTPKMNGTWIGIGSSYWTGKPVPPDAFMQFTVKVLNETSLIVDNYDTLQYKSTDSSRIINFYHNSNSGSSTRINEEWLHYDAVRNSMSYHVQRNASLGGMYMSLNSSIYKPNQLVKNYIAEIIGAKVLSGYGYDSTSYPKHDTAYTLTVIMNFAAINDSTITFDQNFLDIDDIALHYKLTDYMMNTITFQNFHVHEYRISTLTYNYVTKHITLEQKEREVFSNKYILLQ